MKFTTVLPFVTLALSVTAEPVLVNRQPTLVQRDIAAITNVLNAVSSGLTTLDAAVNAFSGDSSAIDSDGSALQATINAGATTATASGDLSLNDAIGLTGPVQALQTVGATLVADLIAKKSAIEAAGKCEDVSSQVSGIQSSSVNLINAIVALVPSAAQALAAQLAAPFQATLASGVAAFAPGSCVDAVSTPPPATTSSTSSPAGTTSASVAPTTSASSPPTTSGSATASGSTTSAAATTYTAKTTSSPATGTGTGAIVKASASSTVLPYTGAADLNRANSFGMLAIAAALFVL